VSTARTSTTHHPAGSSGRRNTIAFAGRSNLKYGVAGVMNFALYVFQAMGRKIAGAHPRPRHRAGYPPMYSLARRLHVEQAWPVGCSAAAAGDSLLAA